MSVIKDYVKLWADYYTLLEDALFLKRKTFTDCWLRDLPFFVTEVLQLSNGLSVTICCVNQL